MTEQRGPLAAVVDRWQQALSDLDMGPDGLFRVELHCLRCGKLLNADGNHPAEVHAGTCNGLCYACTSASPYVESVAILDGCRKISWPPHCPSWRRDREIHYGYLDCPGCKGLGAAGYHGWGSAAQTCKPCSERFFGHPARALASDYSRKLRESAQRAFTARLHTALGLPRRCSGKRFQAALSAMDSAVKEEIRQDVLSRYSSLRERHERRIARSQAWDWRAPRPDEVLAA